tara:strand:+ start:790 stop:1056 length:267 start_codon:yes stop_codon:yes gene_type:complete
MINPDDYEGHTPGPWEWYDDDIIEAHGDRSSIARMEYDYKKEDAILMTDAPLLLEAYRELRDYHVALLHWVMYHLDKDEDEVKEMIYE